LAVTLDALHYFHSLIFRMHTVVPGWFGISSVWFLPLIWRLVRSVLPGGAGLRGPGTIRLWVGFVCVLVASCTLEAKLLDINGFDALGHLLAAGLGKLTPHAAVPIGAMLALLLVSLPWFLDFRWFDVLVWADQSLGLGLNIGSRRSETKRAQDLDTGPAQGLGSANTFDPSWNTLDGSPRRRPTSWRPPATTAAASARAASTASVAVSGTMAAGAAPGIAAASEAAKRDAAPSWRVEPRLPNAANPSSGSARSEPVAPAGWLRQPASASARTQTAPAWTNDARRPTGMPMERVPVVPPMTPAPAGTTPWQPASARAAGTGTGARTAVAASLAVPAASSAAQRAAALSATSAAARAGRAVAPPEPLTSPFASPALNRRSAPPPVAGSTAARAAASAPTPRPPKPARPFVWPTKPARNGVQMQPGTPSATTSTTSFFGSQSAGPAGAQLPAPPAENALDTLRAIEENAARWTTLAGASLARRVNADALTANANGANASAKSVAAPRSDVAASITAAGTQADLRQPVPAAPPPLATQDTYASEPMIESIETGTTPATSMPVNPMSHVAGEPLEYLYTAPSVGAGQEIAAPAVTPPVWPAITMPVMDEPVPAQPAWMTNSHDLPSWTLLDDEPQHDDVEAPSEPVQEAAPLPVADEEPVQPITSHAPADVPVIAQAGAEPMLPATTTTAESPFPSAPAQQQVQSAGSNVVRFPRIVHNEQHMPTQTSAQDLDDDADTADTNAGAIPSWPSAAAFAQPAPAPAPETIPFVSPAPASVSPPMATPPVVTDIPPAPWVAEPVPETPAPWSAPVQADPTAASGLPPVAGNAFAAVSAAPTPTPNINAAAAPDATQEAATRAPAVRGHAPTSFAFEPLTASAVELPGLDLLERASSDIEPVPEEKLAETGQLIEQRLQEFKVPVTVVGASAGPVITRFEVEPALGVRGSQIVGLMKDLSRGLGLTSIRVVETIPGKTCMGLELPNARRQTIRLSEILESAPYERSQSKLTIAMGKDIVGHPVVTDLAKAPHMLVAGTTGSGKSVAINAMILSLLYKATPEDVRLIMIDPKMLELSVYEGIPHLLAPVVTDMKLAANALNWCVGEMEKRYRLMSAVGVRNLAGFNQKIRDAHAHGKKIGNPFSLTPDAPEPLAPLPMIVVVIDELADLMMVAGKKIEELIARLAQKARAAGIHLILATQRPSVDVITGLIKANIPTRVAFQVSSKIDSRTILDQMGAESLLGQGDMLFLPPGTGYPQRVHGAFVADEEVHAVVEYLKQFGEPEYIEGILDGPTGDGAPQDLFGDAPDAEADPLYDEAVAFIVRTRRVSISSVQRQLRIGYNRAARLVEQMEAAGLVSPMGINGSREVLLPPGQGE